MPPLFRLPPVEEIVVSASPGETRAAILRGGAVWGLTWDWPDKPNPVGGVYAVRITRMAPQARGAFVVVDTQGQEGFLDLSNLTVDLHEGQRLLAQATRAPEAGKRLTLTPAVRLVGRHLVYTPMRAGISASRQIKDKALAQKLQGLLKAALRPEEGAIVRAAAADPSVQAVTVLTELDRHRAAWTAANAGTDLGLAIAPAPMLAALLIERVGAGPVTITVDTPALLPSTKASVASWIGPEPVSVHLDRDDPFARLGAEEAFIDASNSEFALAGGGTLWLEQTRAGWMVDVDSGQAQGMASAVRAGTNSAAAIEIARQVRLRQASGLIVIDFLRMTDPSAQASIVQTLRRAFAEDPAPLRFNPGFDPLGFYAFSRGRIAAPLALREADGGYTATVLAGLRALVRAVRTAPSTPYTLWLSPAALSAAGGLPLAMHAAEAQLGQKVMLREDASLRRGSYAVRPTRQEPTHDRPTR